MNQALSPGSLAPVSRETTCAVPVLPATFTPGTRARRAVPLSLQESKKHPIPNVVEIRGEVFMPNAEFARMNKAVVAAGDEPFANPRNATAGTFVVIVP